MAETEDLANKISHIRLQPWFKPLTAEEVKILAGLLIKKTFPQGSIIVKEGDLVDSVYMIISGDAEVQKSHVEHNEVVIQVLATMKPGSAIGLNETGFYSSTGRRTATVMAKTDVTCWHLSVAAFHGFVLAYPHVSEVMRMNVNTFAKNEG